MQANPPQKGIEGFSVLIQYLVQNKIDETFIQNSIQMVDSRPLDIQANPTLMCLLTYYLLAHENYTQLLKLLNRTTDPELLCIKLVA